jgi:hypothetical protein
MEKSKETRPTSPCLFLSYSSGDRPLAQHLRDNLARYLEVFIDTKSIPGGAEWEREIDRAVRDCTIFAPIVSEASNNSRWVARETLLAVNIGVPIVPLLFSDNLPLRIVDLQFIDFRDNFEAGLSDLLSAISGHTGPLRSSAEATDRLIARAIRARLRGDLREANALVEQFVGIDIELASSAYTFWRKLESALASDLAGSVGPRLYIRENTSQMSTGQYKDRNAFLWALEIHGADKDLEMIDAVVYTLHPTFDNRIQKVRSREDHFRLQRVGWGRFSVQIHVDFVDHTAVDSTYMLTFAETHEARLLTV